MFNFIKQVFIAFLSFSESFSRVAKVSDRTKCIYLINEPSLARPTLIDLNSNELYYYPFMVNLDKFNGSYNTLHNLLSIIYAQNKIEDVNLNIFNMITTINETRTSTKHISCDCKCNFDGRKFNSNQKWNDDKDLRECKNPTKHHVCKKDYI